LRPPGPGCRRWVQRPFREFTAISRTSEAFGSQLRGKRLLVGVCLSEPTRRTRPLASWRLPTKRIIVEVCCSTSEAFRLLGRSFLRCVPVGVPIQCLAESPGARSEPAQSLKTCAVGCEQSRGHRQRLRLWPPGSGPSERRRRANCCVAELAMRLAVSPVGAVAGRKQAGHDQAKWRGTGAISWGWPWVQVLGVMADGLW